MIARDSAQQNIESPFIAAKREWNERYGDYIAQARNWRLAAILSLAISTILAVGSMWLAGQTKLVPFVVQVDKLGSAVAVGRADRATSPNVAIVRAQLAQWITNARSASSDATAERATLTTVYALLSTSAKPYLDDWYRAHSPFEIGAQHTVAVTINDVLPQSSTTYQVQWTEEARDLDGSHAILTHWVAGMTVGFNPPADEATILRNPMGIYITQLNWTQRL